MGSAKLPPLRRDWLHVDDLDAWLRSHPATPRVVA